MLRFAAHLPDPAVGLAPVLERALDLAADDRPGAIVERSLDSEWMYTESSSAPHTSCWRWLYAPLPMRTGRAPS